MTDLTPTFNALLAAHDAPPLSRSLPPPKSEFLKEAYRIQTHIRTLSTHLAGIRQSYLAITHNGLTDPQRDAVDAETAALLRECLAVTTRLESTERIRHGTALALHRKKLSSFSGLFLQQEAVEAEEAQLETERAWREAVVVGLKAALELVGARHKAMVESRLKREVERRKSILAGGVHSWRGAVLVEDEEVGELEPEQLQLLQVENDGLVKLYEDALGQVRTAEKSLLEISELQSQLASNLAVQNAHIDNLVADSLQTTENMERGNKELKKAGEKFTMARSAFWSAVTFAGVVIVWDWFI